MMMVIPGWDVAVPNWGFVRVRWLRWLSHAAVGILKFSFLYNFTILHNSTSWTDWNDRLACLDAALRLCQRLLVYKMEIFSICLSGLAVQIKITFLQTRETTVYKFNFFSLNVSNFMHNSNPLGTGRLIILLFVVSAAFNCFAVFHWVLQEDYGQICINFMSSCATTFSHKRCWNSKMFSHVEDLWSLYEWLSGSACTGCMNFWKCNSEGLSALNFGLSAMSLGRCARWDSLVLKEIPQEATSFDNSWYSFGWNLLFPMGSRPELL